jgi:hypothetical protein
MYEQYAATRSHKNVTHFVGKNLQRFQNPSQDKILKLCYSFSKEWGDSMKLTLDGETGDALNSIVANRNSIAHGGQPQITFGRIEKYYSNAHRVLDKIEEHCR